ncbi:MAG TPA: hypothetical protein VHB47_11835 [Thermoanaerobaculia bacterium]|jgi:hypothetical protein|nr:hypothetical protein [Thermoanaerobaculia bacterium]
MQQVFRVKWVLAAAALCIALGAGALLAQDKAAAASGGVTIQNDSKRAIQVFARYGSEGSCEHAPNQVELNVAAGSSSTVDSGSSKVCLCLDIPDRNTCPTGWAQVKAGGKRVFR